MAMGDVIRTGQAQISNVTPTQIIDVKLKPGKPMRGIQLKAPITNKDVVYIGQSDLTTLTGYPLEPGKEIPIPIEGINSLFGIAAVNRDKIAWIVV